MSTFLPTTRALCAPGRLVFSTALILCLALTCPAQNSAVSFTAAQPVSLPQINPGFAGFAQTSPYPACTSLFAGKFHHSSQMDFVATCQAGQLANTINSALLNQGNGAFTLVDDSVTAAAGYLAALSVDLNGDGFDDLILLSNGNGTSNGGFAAQLSNGDGTFKAPVSYAPKDAPNVLFSAAVAGDFEDNGRMDIALLSSNTLYIFLNDGTGEFTQSASYTLTPPSGGSGAILVAGDLNGDHKTDLAVVFSTTSGPGTVTPYISEGNGQFTKGGSYSVGSNPFSAAIGNFDTSSAYGDIAVSNSTGVTVLLGSSSGAFSTSKSTPYPSPIGGGGSPVTGDFDKDGNLDLAFISGYPNPLVIVFWGAGNGSFPSYSAYSIPIPPVALVSTDINDDGRQDLAVAGGDGSVTLLYNIAARVFRAAPNTHSPLATGIAAADFNRDGKKDVAVVNTPSCAAPCDGTVTVLPGEGNYFAAGKTYTIGMHGSAIAAGDINGDGVLDLVVTNSTAGDSADTSILLGIKGGGFEPAHNIKLGALSNDAFLVDMNGDGKLDLVEDSGVAFGDGKGDFGSLIPFPDGIVATTTIAVADFNGDGHPDVVALGQQADVLINNGKGDFTATPLPLNEYSLPGEVFAVTAGPLKSGGPNDIVFTGIDTFDGNVGDQTFFFAFVVLNDGKGNFTPANYSGIGAPGLGLDLGASNSMTVTIADFNHDGYPDIGFSLGSLFFVSTGPDFNNATLFPVSSGPFNTSAAYFAVADFNNDGWPDVVFTNSYGISRLYNVPVPTISPSSLTWTSSGTKKVTIKNTTKTAQSIEVAVFGQTFGPAGPSPFKITSNTCTSSLAVGATCTVSVEYSNSGAEFVEGSISINANGVLIDAVGFIVN